MSGMVRFGVYELDPAGMTLLKHGTRIRLQEQPFRVLLSLIERPGEIVTREQLKERIWAQNTFVDFDQSLNKAVNRLREALNDDAGNPRYIETVPRRGYRFVAPVTGMDSSATPPAAPAEIPDRIASWDISPTKIIAAAALVLTAGITALALLWNSKAPSQHAPIRITTDGNSMQPALSRDGKLLAYMSAVDGGIGHIWVRNMSSGIARQVTRGVGESEPSFSPDGTSIAFRSEVDDGGVYITPTFGGETRLVAKGALWPRFSPDGEQILCLDAELRGIVVPTRSSAPAILPERLDLMYPALGHQTVPLWGPDGNQILYLEQANGPMGTGTSRWRIAFPAKGESKTLSFHDWDGNWERLPLAYDWTQMKDGRQWIVYSAPTGDSRNLFRMPISPNGGVLGKPEQLTAGPGLILYTVLSRDGKLAFTSASLNEQIHAIPITNLGEGNSGLNSRLTRHEGVRNYSPTISRDGRWLAYAADSLRGDQATIRVRDLVNGSDRLLVDHVDPVYSDFLSISPDGSRVLFAHFLKWNRTNACTISVIDVVGGLPERLSEICGAPRGFSLDGSRVLLQKATGMAPDRVVVLDLLSKREREFLRHSHRGVYHAFFSWDDKWVVFKTVDENRWQIVIAPVRSGTVSAEAEWISVTDGRHADDKAQFSPDGNQIYFTSDRDGYLCLWAQPLDHETKRPIGTAHAVRHFHNAMWRYPMVYNPYGMYYNPYGATLSVARDKIVTNLVETHSDIWMLQVH